MIMAIESVTLYKDDEHRLITTNPELIHIADQLRGIAPKKAVGIILLYGEM